MFGKIVKVENEVIESEEVEAADFEEEIQKPYIFRKLNASDIFLMCKIIGKIGIDKVANCFSPKETADILNAFSKDGELNDDEMASVGINVAIRIAGKIVENLPQCETEIFSLLANVSNLEVDEVKVFDMEVFLQMIVDFIKKEEFKNFMKVASKFVK